MCGNYLKFSRDVSQTRWPDTNVTSLNPSTSVEEEIARVAGTRVPCKETKFHAAGREDVDVRMLGDGRPFALEFVDARVAALSPAVLAEIVDGVNGGSDVVQIRDIHAGDKVRVCVCVHAPARMCVCLFVCVFLLLLVCSWSRACVNL